MVCNRATRRDALLDAQVSDSDVHEWAIQNSLTDSSNESPTPPDVPQVVHDRKISNIVSCLFIVALYAIMVFKPGTLFWKDGINIM